MKWKQDAKEGVLVSGSNEWGGGCMEEQINLPRQIELDEDDNIYLSERNCSAVGRGNIRRFLKKTKNYEEEYPGPIVAYLGDEDYDSFVIDKVGNVFVLNFKENQLVKWGLSKNDLKDNPDSQGIKIAGKNGKGSDLNQLNLSGHHSESTPQNLKISDLGDIYISDTKNNRVIKVLNYPEIVIQELQQEPSHSLELMILLMKLVKLL